MRREDLIGATIKCVPVTGNSDRVSITFQTGEIVQTTLMELYDYNVLTHLEMATLMHHRDRTIIVEELEQGEEVLEEQGEGGVLNGN